MTLVSASVPMGMDVEIMSLLSTYEYKHLMMMCFLSN